MKFSPNEYYKHDDNKDTFIFTTLIKRDADEIAELDVVWCTQGSANYWTSSPIETIIITPNNYPKWHKYQPTGTML